ncbi:hypothetical protein LSCM1_06103 [Leishmania martiniquensis]|uniref:Uncharacterized protein n=1 Tax=Leishmania martiniquensis TaxID=1580590 RepID=A0A836KK48_9TRYP|nr:hypothetical protein LSCM1_06103 [Leishmania martiniquensis]
MEPHPSARILTGDARTSSFSPSPCDSTGHGALVTRLPRHGGGNRDAFRQHDESGGQPTPPLRISTRRLQVFSYVLAELSSATTLLPDYTKAILNLSRRLVGAWQAVTAAAVARTRYEHALVWAIHQQWRGPDASSLRPPSPRGKTTEGGRGFVTVPRRSLRRREREQKKRSSSMPATAAATASCVPPSAAGVLFDSVAALHKRRRLTREATSATASWTAGGENQRARKPPPPRTHAPRGDGMPASLRFSSPMSCSRHLRADGGVTPLSRALLDRHRSVRHDRSARRWHRRFLQMTLQHLWCGAQEAEDRAGQNVEHIRGLVINALYQQYLQVTVEASYHDLVLYRWLSPSLFAMRRSGAGARQAGSHHGRRQRHRSASAHQGDGSLWYARQHQAAVQVAADLRLLRHVLCRPRIAAGPSPDTRRRSGSGGSGVVVASPATKHSGLLDPPASSSTAAAESAVPAENCAPFANVGGCTAAAGADREGSNGDGAAAPRPASAGSSQSSFELSSSDTFSDRVLAVPMLLRSFLQACLSFDPTHCAFALMSRCVVLAQHVRSEDDEQAIPHPVTPDEKGAQGGVSRGGAGVVERVDNESSEGYFGLFYVVIARRAVGACDCSAMCFGNHKFIFVRCHDTEALLREAMAEAESDESADEGSEGSTAATADEEDLHLAHVSRRSAEATATASTSYDEGEEADKVAGVDTRAQLSNSVSAAAALTPAIKGLRGRLRLLRLHAHGPHTKELTLPARAQGIRVLGADDARRLRRDASEYSDSGECRLVEEAKPPQRVPPQAGAHAPLSSLTSAPPSGSPHGMPLQRPHALKVLYPPAVPIEPTPAAAPAWSSATLRVAAHPSPIAAAQTQGRSLNEQAPSALVKRPPAEALSASLDHSSSGSVRAAASGEGSTAATTAPACPALTPPMFPDARNSAASGSGASAQSGAAREDAAPSCSPLTRQLQGVGSALPDDGAVVHEDNIDAECSRAPALSPPHTDRSRLAASGLLSTRCIASATHPITNAARLPLRSSSSASLATSSSSTAAFRGLNDDDEAERVHCFRRLPRRRGLGAEYSDRITDRDDEWDAEEEEDAAAVDGDVFGGGSTNTQVFVVMHSLLCSFGADGTTKGGGGAAGRATAALSPFTSAATPDFFELRHLRRQRPNTRAGDSAWELPPRSCALCTPHADFPLSYFEQHVLLPPGSGHERRAGVGRSGRGVDEGARPRAQSIEARWPSPPPAPLPAHAGEPADARRGRVSSRARGASAAVALAEYRVAGTAQGAEVPRMEEPALTPLDLEEGELYDGAQESTAAKEKGTSSCRRLCGSGAAGVTAVEPSEGDMAFAAELYARLQFWSLRGQDRSAYIDPSWIRQPSHTRHEEVQSRTWSASNSVVGDAEGLGEGGAECHLQQPTAPLADHTTGAGGLRGVPSGMARAAPGTEARDKSPPGARSQSSRYSPTNACKANEARNSVRLPLRLLHCTVGTIEVADEASLASARSGSRRRKRRRAAQVEERQTKRGPPAEGEGETTEEDADEPSATEAEEGGEGRGRLPLFPPFTTVNARGKELLFEALREATEVVVCGVRESRAHTGYHDVLHQRCPTPPPPASASTASASKPGARSGGDVHNAGYSLCAGAAAATPAGTLSKSRWLTTVNPWMAAATAAARGRGFRVEFGTLSRDERSPFAFDTHLHVGACGIVHWSQGDISHEEEAGESPTDPSSDPAVLPMADPASVSASRAAEGVAGGAAHRHDHAHRSESPQVPKSRWPKLPANDYKQWRCELLKSEFRLARSRCLDCLLVDHTHGRPIAAMTLAPRVWPQASLHSALDTDFTGAGDGTDEGTQPRRCTGRYRSDAEATEVPSPQEVVQRTVYVVTGFTHYVAPLWRHLREEKAILVDMDRTLIDNAITVRSAAERQRHIRLLRRVMAVAEGVVAASNPCLLWHRHMAPSSAFFADGPLRLGRNDAARLTKEELAEAVVRGVGEEQGDVWCHGEGVHQRYGGRTLPFVENFTEALEDDGVLRPTIRPRPLHSSESTAFHTKAAAGASPSSSGGLLHRFMRRTASQRQRLGIVHYEECGAVKYTAGHLRALGRNSANSASSKSSRDHHCSSFDNFDTRERSSALSEDTDVFRPNSEEAAATAADTTVATPDRYFLDVVYVRPGVRQFLYRVATQWNIPLVLVTKSSRSRTEAILRQVLDPHRVLFPDMQSSVVTADEMLRWSDEDAVPLDAVDEDEGAREEPSTDLADHGEGVPVQQSSSASSGVCHIGQVCLVPLHTAAPTSTTERIARCRKATLRVVRCTLDAAAMATARRAWRAPAWCDWPNRLPKPRSIAVVDDAPQVWAESDWPCTVSVSPYTLARVDPQVYFSRRGYAASLVLSCLYGSKCLKCSEGVLRRPEWQEAAMAPSSFSPHTPSASLSTGASPGLGAYNWPHCVCVCPPGHLRDISRAEEGAPAGYHNTSDSGTASDLSASVSAMLRALLWRMPNKATLRGSQQPLLLPASEGPVATEMAGEAKGAEGQTGAARRGDCRRRRRPLHMDDLGATIAPAGKGFSGVFATAECAGRRATTRLATWTPAAASGGIGRGARLQQLDPDGSGADAPPPSPSLRMPADATDPTFTSASVSDSARSASSPSCTSSPSLSATASSSSSMPFAWGGRFSQTAANHMGDTGSNTPSTIITAASMPPTPIAFRATSEPWRESKVPDGEAEADADEQQPSRLSAGNLCASTALSGETTVGEEDFMLLAPGQGGCTAANTIRYGAPHLSSNDVGDVIPLGLQAAPSMAAPLCTPGGPSDSFGDVGGGDFAPSVDVDSLSTGSSNASWVSGSIASVPAEDVVPMPSAPETFTEGLTVDADQPAPPEIYELELQSPWRYRLNGPRDEVEDVTPL